jgi:hypothetical protein
VVEFSGDSLSTFTSEQKLAIRRGAPEGAAPLRVRLGARPLIALLLCLVLGQAGLIGWWWIRGGTWPGARATTAGLVVTSEPPGAEVTIDGTARGTTPLTIQLDGGRHDLTVGTDPAAWARALDVQPGVPSSIHVVLTPPAIVAPAASAAGTLEITTEPAGLAVSVDGRPRGVSPISVTGLEPGSHEVSVTRGPTVVRRTVSVGAGTSTAVLISTAGPGIASGWLTVTAPVPVRILENGTLIGSSDTPRLLVPVGRHDLEFSNDTFGYRATRTVQVAAGQAASVALEPAMGTLSVNAQPWGEVWIDGRRIGETPIGNLPLAIGNHELVVRHPQLGERRRTVAVSVNAPARVGIDMRQ